MNIIESNYHSEWQTNRLIFILKKYGEKYFKNQKILELGSFNGFFGESFRLLGANVLSVEGREENVQNIKNTYPNLNVICKNLDTKDWDFGSYDIIINFGLFYHLEKYHEDHLINCIDHSHLMFFETVVFDSYEPEIFMNPEIGIDQSLSNLGGYPSISYVENIFKNKKCKYQKYTDPSLNGRGYSYDCEEKNTKEINCRKFWVVE